MSLTNPFGDFEVTDPQAMRALAHPVRLRILAHLQRRGQSTATRLAPEVGATPSVTSWHLRHLAKFGLVADADAGSDGRQRWWRATARGIRFDAPADDTDAQGLDAYRLLSMQLLSTGLDEIRAWATDTAPHLEPRWLRVSGTSNTTVPMTREEAEEIQLAIEKLLVPYVTRRDSGDVPALARPVKLLRYWLPEAEDEYGAGTAPGDA